MKKSCKKKSDKCRFHFPKLPSLNTFIAIPARIKYPGCKDASDVQTADKAKFEHAKDIKAKVKLMLQNEEQMEQLCNDPSDVQCINEYMKWVKYAQLSSHIRCMQSNKIDNDPKIVDDFFARVQ